MHYLVIGILLIVGGASGTVALRGTHSANALIALGAAFALLGFVQLARGSRRGTTTRRRVRQRRRPTPPALTVRPRRVDQQQTDPELASPTGRGVARPALQRRRA